MARDTNTSSANTLDDPQVLVVNLDRDFGIVSVNDAFAQVCGKAADSLCGNNFLSLFPHRDNAAIFQRVLETGQPYIAYARAVSPDGHDGAAAGCWDWVLLPVTGKDRDIRGLVLSLREVVTGAAVAHYGADSAQLYQQFFISNPAINVISVKQDGRLLDVNAAFETFTGYSREEVIGKTTYELGIWLESEDRTRLLQAMETRPHTRFIEIPIKTKSGDIRFGLGAVEEILIDGQECLIFTGNDITDSEHDLSALAQLENRFSKVFYGSPIIITISDLETGRFLDVNQAFADLVDFPREEIIGKTSIEMGFFADSGQRQGLKEQMEQTPIIHAEIPFRRRNGELRYTLGSIDTIHIDGKRWILFMATDMTDRIAADMALRESERNLRALAENSNDGIYVSTGDKTVFVNRRMAEMLEYSMEELYARDLSELIHPDEYHKVRANVEARLSGGPAPTQYETIAITGSGREIPVDITGSLTDWRGDRAVVGTVRDISERKAHEADLREYREHLEDMVDARTMDLRVAKEEAEYANKAKTEFLSRVSHELRTPLNAILGYAQVLMMDHEPLSLQQQEGIREIYVSGKHLLELINELLDISRIESDRMEMNIEPLSIVSVVGEALSIIKPQSEQYGVEVRNDIDICDCNCMVLCDRTRLLQVLLNLFSNGVKYTEEGGLVTVNCSRQGDSFVRVSVNDNGQGISESQRKQLFEPFNRLGAEYSGIEGTGIGLAITKRLVELMAGQIEIESTPGVGTSFHVDLPIAQAETCPVTQAAPQQSR